MKQEKCFQNKKTISFRFKKTKKIQKLGIKVKVKKTKQKTKKNPFFILHLKKGREVLFSFHEKAQKVKTTTIKT